jgi:hypothetical protein
MIYLNQRKLLTLFFKKLYWPQENNRYFNKMFDLINLENMPCENSFITKKAYFVITLTLTRMI